MSVSGIVAGCYFLKLLAAHEWCRYLERDEHVLLNMSNAYNKYRQIGSLFKITSNYISSLFLIICHTILVFHNFTIPVQFTLIGEVANLGIPLRWGR